MPEYATLYFPPTSNRMSVLFGRRTRQGVRERLAALGGRISPEDNVVNLPEAAEDAVRAILAEEYPTWTLDVRDERPGFREPGDRIAWVNQDVGRSREHNGYVGRLKVFQVRRYYSSSERAFEVVTELPVPAEWRHHLRAATEQEAERGAEAFFDLFLRGIGATLPGWDGLRS
jgi:hypothetical protein